MGKFEFTEFPVIETERLVLVKPEYRDAADILETLANQEVVRYTGQMPFVSLQDAEDEIKWYHNIFEKKQGIRWGLKFKEAGSIIGSCGFKNYVPESNKAEIGYELNCKYWGKGVMTEAALAVLKFGFEEMGLNRVEAFIDPANAGSIKVLQKLGFLTEGTLRDCEFENGRYIDLIVMSQLKREFAALHKLEAF